MIKRLLWLGIGIGVGALVVRRVTKAVQAYSPAGLAGSARNSAAGVLGSMKDFVADVREGMAEREEQIHWAIERGVSIEDMDDHDGPYEAYGWPDEDGAEVRR